MDAAGLIFIQFSDPDACMDLRTRHADVLNQLVEILKTRNIDLRDAEGFLIKFFLYVPFLAGLESKRAHPEHFVECLEHTPSSGRINKEEEAR
ncbi:hypothetical protein ONZ45_g15575 [Pleurotus djamor]|nr:hypothetical protein ONZ45_g15575 [Pleurotus djamor]